MVYWCNHCGHEHDSSACPAKHTSFQVSSASVTWATLRMECIKELGYALMYMDYLEPFTDPRTGRDAWESQRKRVEELCRECARNFRLVELTYWQHFLKQIRDEIENMC